MYGTYGIEVRLLGLHMHSGIGQLIGCSTKKGAFMQHNFRELPYGLWLTCFDMVGLSSMDDLGEI